MWRIAAEKRRLESAQGLSAPVVRTAQQDCALSESTRVGDAFERGAASAQSEVAARTPQGAVAATALALRTGTVGLPIDADRYGAIVDELQQADWRRCGIDPWRYTADRLDEELVLRPLREQPDARVVLHRRAMTVGQAPGVDPQRLELLTKEEGRDYPGRVYRERGTNTLHVVGIPGEDWFTQTLFMLATAEVPQERIFVEGTPDADGLAARELDRTLAAYDFDSVVVGVAGALTRAVERELRVRDQGAHTARCLDAMGAHLEERVASARADRRERWEGRQHCFQEIVAASASPDEAISRIESEPELRSALAEQLRAVRDGAAAADLPMTSKNGKAEHLTHRILQVDGETHLLLHIGGAHGDLAHAALKRVLDKEPTLRRVGFFGTCGSFDGDRLPPDTVVRPEGQVLALDPSRPAVFLENAVRFDDAKAVKHTNVSTLLQEHQAGLMRLEATGDTVDIEGYHVARAVAEARQGGREIELRMLLRVSDVADDPSLGAHRVDRAATSDYDGRRDAEQDVVIALGLVDDRTSSAAQRTAP
ncbi:MAG: hypothetical protein ACO3JL_04315 [Myxococcota bacterium]